MSGHEEHLAPDPDTKAHRRCRCEFSSGGVQAKTCAHHQRQLAAKQAQIDRLMLEYCPDEMSTEQLEEWGKHQRPAAHVAHD